MFGLPVKITSSRSKSTTKRCKTWVSQWGPTIARINPLNSQMTNNNKVDNQINNHRSRNHDLSLNNIETRADPHKDDLSQPRHKVKDPILARNMTTTHRTSRTTIGITLKGLSHKTKDRCHS
jgi:hypothetical protein